MTKVKIKKDGFLQIRINKEDKATLKAIAKENGLKLAELLDLKIKQILDGRKNGELDNDVKLLAYDKLMRKQGVLRFEDIKQTIHY